MWRSIVLAALISASLSASSFVAKFNYDFTGMTPCGATVATSCMDHFEIGVLSGAGTFQVVSTVVSTGTGPVTGITSQPFALVGFGSITLSAVAVGKDNAGNRITSSPQAATTVVSVSPPAPSGMTVASQP